MERPTPTKLRIGAWTVDPVSGEISRGSESAHLEVRAMRLLLCLAEHAGQVVSIDELLNHVWTGVTVSPDSVYQAVTSLRRLLGDDPKHPAYIATVPRLGYRMVATVGPGSPSTTVDPSTQSAVSPSAIVPTAAQPAGSRLRIGLTLTAIGVLCLVLVAIFLFHGKTEKQPLPVASVAPPQPQRSIAVLPFLDLTQEMNEEPFADGMTEELIDKLSKIPGLRVPGATSSFYFKGKRIPVAEIARNLGVSYVLDGSVRKSGDRLRVAARLVRADNGYVVWSETYDRPFHDILMVQDNIAGEVAKALRASTEFKVH